MRQSRWVLPTLALITLAAGVMYAWGIRLGMVHDYYNPAVHSMSTSWKAFFWMGYDPAASITLDKLPLSFQVEALSARLFGFSTWSVLMPQVVEACLTIVAIFWVVRRWMGAHSSRSAVWGLVAAAMYATTPVVAALAHAQITDTLLVLLLVVAAGFLLAAVESGRWWPLLLWGVFVGLAFQAKMAQAWGVLPAFALVYLLAAPGGWGRRVVRTVVAGVVTLAVSVWWMVVVSLVPASQRPWIDGSTTNSVWDMVFVYNLLGRYETGEGVQSPGMGGGSGQGWQYMLSSAITTQVGWLYPLAAVGVVLGLVWRWRRPRTDLTRAGLLLFATWFGVHAVAFSIGRVAHSFYVVAVAPAVVALAALAVRICVLAWQAGGWRRAIVPVVLALQLGWAVMLQRQFPEFRAWSVPLALALGGAALATLGVAWALERRAGRGLTRVMQRGAAVLALGSVLTIPAVWAASTVEQQYAGSTIGPSAGPTAMGGFGGGRAGGASGGFPGGGRDDAPTGEMPEGEAPEGMPNADDRSGGQMPSGGGQMPTGSGQGAGQGVDTTVAEWLQAHDPGSTYLAAMPRSQAASWLLAGYDVLPMGGFSGSIGYPSATELQKLVASGELRYVVLGGSAGMAGGRGGASSEVNDWVELTCTLVTDEAVASAQIYDCRS